MIGRRSFVKAMAIGAAGMGMACAGTSAERGGGGPPSPSPPPPPKPLKILILGGTGFLGPHLVDAARARGHVLTLFNRGKTHPGLFPDIEQLHGDRDGHLEALAGRAWDAVLDTSGYVPRVVEQSAKLLAPSVGRYLFVSTISVYKSHAIVGMDEHAEVETLPPEAAGSEEVMKYYGALKALCEQTIEAALSGRAIVVRPGLIVGPGDETDRFTYWPVRVARGGEVLAPGSGKDPVQFVDARDLAAFCVKLVEGQQTGVYNATGPATVLPMAAMLDACKRAAGSDARFTWVDAEWLDKHEVQAWSDMPVWVPDTPEDRGFTQIDARKGIAAGLTFRPAEETAKATLAWWSTLPEERRAKMKAGITAERETELLAKWRAK
jgi:2'-hydroxyisoflavone reductase